MKIRLLFLCASLLCAIGNSGHAGPIEPLSKLAGQSGLPFNENQDWPGCSKNGWKKYDQYHMQKNSKYGYHMGEDWNGKCGGSTDQNAPLLAIADGKVVYIDLKDDNGKGKQIYIRHSFPYAHASNDILSCDSAFLHINNIEASNIIWSGKGTGSYVQKGDTVAFLGGTGGWTPHLHWEMQCDNDPKLLTENTYQKKLNIDHALKFLPPSLVVDDRRDVFSPSILSSGNNTFVMPNDAPSSIAYLERKGERKSLKKAIEAGWINADGVQHQAGSSWEHFADIDDNFFEAGKKYAIYPLFFDVTLHIPLPGHKFQADRARLDMLHAVKKHSSDIATILTDKYQYMPKWISDWNLHLMEFETTWGEIIYAAQVTNVVNPLIRYTTYIKPRTSDWTPWKRVDRNKLY